jgi:hypothetical protein
MLLASNIPFFFWAEMFLLKLHHRAWCVPRQPREKLAMLLVAALLPGVMAGCGGGGSAGPVSSTASVQNSNLSSGTIPGGGVTNPGGILLAAPTPVTVAANQNTIAVDIQVPAVASTINVTGVAITAPLVNQTYARSAGVGVRQGNQYWLWIIGSGITPSLTLSFSGPADITVGGPVLATQGCLGAIYPITVSAGAALGARSIILQDANSNLATLAGALEVCSASASNC